MTFPECSTKSGWLLLSALQKQDDFRWELYESRITFVECSTKAGWLWLRALRKQDDFRWLLYKSRMTFVESSTKAGLLSFSALRKQDDFPWVLYENRMTLVESSMKAGWVLFRALWKPFKKRVNRDITKFRDKIAYVGGPPFRKRPNLSVNAVHAFVQHLPPCLCLIYITSAWSICVSGWWRYQLNSSWWYQ